MKNSLEQLQFSGRLTRRELCTVTDYGISVDLFVYTQIYTHVYEIDTFICLRIFLIQDKRKTTP